MITANLAYSILQYRAYHNFLHSFDVSKYVSTSYVPRLL